MKLTTVYIFVQYWLWLLLVTNLWFEDWRYPGDEEVVIARVQMPSHSMLKPVM